MHAPGTPSSQRPLAGIAWVMVGLFLFSLQDIIIKYFSDAYSVLQIVFIRSAVGVTLLLMAMLMRGGWRGMLPRQPKLMLFKGFLAFCAYLAYYMALAALPLVDAVIIVFSAPIMITVMSALLLKERVGARRWAVLLVGFAAIVMVMGPGGDFRHLATALALLAAFTYACSTVLTRFVDANSPRLITLYSMFAFLIASAVGSALVMGLGGAGFSTENPALQFLLRPWNTPSLGDGLLMAFLGLNCVFAMNCLVHAYWVSPASVVAPFEYTYIIWAALFGYLIWAEVPRVSSMLGVALLIGCGCYLFRGELRLSRATALAKN